MSRRVAVRGPAPNAATEAVSTMAIDHADIRATRNVFGRLRVTSDAVAMNSAHPSASRFPQKTATAATMNTKTARMSHRCIRYPFLRSFKVKEAVSYRQLLPRHHV